MKAAEIKELTDEELAVKLEETKKEYLNLRFAATTQQLEKPHQIRNAKRTIARMNTVINERNKGKDGKSSS